MTHLVAKLPRPTVDFVVAPFDESGDCGRFLIETERGSFVVNSRMFILLEALRNHSTEISLRAHMEASLGEAISEAEISDALARLPQSLFEVGSCEPISTPFHFSFRLLRAESVQVIAKRLRWLYSPAAFMVASGACLLVLPWLLQVVSHGLAYHLVPADVLLLVLGACITAFLHEAGHATACARYGVAPGEIGFGLYLIFPALYTNVTKAWRLPRMQRAGVDLGGIYFQLILIAALVPIAHVGSNLGWLCFLILYNIYVILHNLNPMFKMDGYWLFSDLAGLPNLHRRTWSFFREAVLGRSTSQSAAPWSARRRGFVCGYAFAIVCYAGFIISTLPRWYAAQLAPYPGIASACFRELGEAWNSSNYGSWLMAFGELVGASFIPALIVALPVSWGVRGFRRLLRRV